MDFGQVLLDAASTVWKHKVLWIFGILAGCSSVNGPGGNNISFQFSGEGDVPRWLGRWFERLDTFPNWQIPGLLGVVILVILALALLFLALGALGRAGLIRGAQLSEGGAVRLTFGDLLGEALPYFWRILALNLLVGIVVILFFGALAVLFVGIAVVTLGIGVLCLLPSLCLIVPLLWLLQVYLELANVALVVDDLDIAAGLRRSWRLVRANVGAVILMGLILTIGVGWIAGIVIGLPLVLGVAPALSGVLLDSQVGIRGGLLLAGVCIVLYLPVLILLNGLLRAFTLSAWTLTYLRLTARPATLESSPS